MDSQVRRTGARRRAAQSSRSALRAITIQIRCRHGVSTTASPNGTCSAGRPRRGFARSPPARPRGWCVLRLVGGPWEAVVSTRDAEVGDEVPVPPETRPHTPGGDHQERPRPTPRDRRAPAAGGRARAGVHGLGRSAGVRPTYPASGTGAARAAAARATGRKAEPVRVPTGRLVTVWGGVGRSNFGSAGAAPHGRSRR